MSLFSTIAHHETPHVRHISRKGLEIALIVLAIGVGLVFAISYDRPTTEEVTAPVATVTGLAYSDFVRLNTTDLEYPVSTFSAFADDAAAANQFAYANVGSYDWLNAVYEERSGVGTAFNEMNVGSYEWLNEILQPIHTVDPGFMAMNIGSYDFLNEIRLASLAADPGFIAMNVGSYDWLNEALLVTHTVDLEWIQQPSGPR